MSISRQNLYNTSIVPFTDILCDAGSLRNACAEDIQTFFHVIHHQKFDNLTGTFDNELWKKLQKYAITLYVEGKGRYPRKLGSDIAELQNDLKYFCKRNVEFLAEVRSVVAKPCCHLDTILQKKDVDLNGHTKLRKLTRLNNVQDTQKVMHELNDSIREAYCLCRHMASEVLVFLISDLDKIHIREKIYSCPIAFALKGYSLNTNVMRQMINDVLNKCLQ